MVFARPKALLATIAGALAAACGGPVALEPGEAFPIVHAFLVGGAPVQQLRIEWSTPHGPETRDSVRPVDPGETDLRIEGPDGFVAVVRPGGAPGSFEADVAATPGARYRLVGTIGRHRIAARTTVPHAPRFTVPSADTIRVARGSETEFAASWTGSPGSLFAAILRASHEGRTANIGIGLRPPGGGYFAFVADSAAFVHIPRIDRQIALDDPRIVLVAYDSVAVSTLGGTPIQNVQGAAGSFGALTVGPRELIVRWE